MATTITFGGTMAGSLGGANTQSGDQGGTPSFGFQFGPTTFVVGAVSPQVEGGGGYSGTFVCSGGAGLLNIADSTNICKANTTGTIAPQAGYVITAVKKLRGIYAENLDTTNNVVVSCPATLFVAGLGWVASQVIVTLQPLGAWVYKCPAGSSVLTAGTNDGLVFTPGAGTPSVRIAAIFG